ncbi:hypothetical protein HYPSUDRAFT_130825 [Hypholoma sublateritium FD-334 SS-4]|uniref:Uncharacterized protein n=1 Tax=Hypholoma sublateritium (strain FD-334 SS-4) TaxID=945553 RepID=A0A0D2Q7R9_HYPSF|nr:hypothetical protein HYPSUDRAFT_130825 [Hypholoma sublateritium FD-334 SS-4]
MSVKPQKLPSKPLPISDVLRDLAVLRSSGCGIPEIFKIRVGNDTKAEDGSASRVDSSVSLSYEYVKESRAAIRLHDSGKLEMQGSKIEEARSKYEGLLDGIDG